MKLDTSEYYPKSPLDDEEDKVIFEEVVATEAAEPEEKPEPETEPRDPGRESPDVPVDVKPHAVRPINFICHVLSVAFVPMLMPVYGILLCFYLTLLALSGKGAIWFYTSITAIFNFFIPCVLIYVLKVMGFIRDIGLNNPKERFVPYLVCVLCLIGTAVFMTYKGAPAWLAYFFIGGAAAGIIEMVVNRWWKISVHAAGVSGIVAMMIYLMIYQYTLPSSFTWLLISLGCAGLVGSSRIWLGRHNLWQVLAGYAVGFCCVFFSMYIS